MNTDTQKKIIKNFTISSNLIELIDAVISKKLYNFAFKRIPNVPKPAKNKLRYQNDYYYYLDWLHQRNTELWKINDYKNRAVATWLPLKNSHKAVLISHAYRGTGETMANFAFMFHSLGYNVLLPDDRGQGRSSGEYLNFGWIDRLDYVKWIKQIINRLGNNCEIILHGVSMGGSTVELTSGEKLPQNVKGFIADCGYSNLADELSYLLNNEFHLRKEPYLKLASLINKFKLGFYINKVSPMDQLKKNKKPILFIHGEKDVYVPTYMGRINYENNLGKNKKLWIVPYAVHAESFWINQYEYKKHVYDFLKLCDK